MLLICCLLTSTMSDEMLQVNLIQLPDMLSVILLLLLSGFPLCLWTFWILCVWVCVTLFAFIILRVHWTSWMYRLMFFMKTFMKVLSHYFFDTVHLFLKSPSGSATYVYVWALNGVSHFSKALFFIFALSSSDCIHSIHLSLNLLILSSDNSNTWLSPSCEFFISVIVLLDCRISIWFLLIIGIFLSLYWYDIFDETLSSYLPLIT